VSRLIFLPLTLAAGLFGAFATPGAAFGNAPIGAEFQVNTYTTLRQYDPSVSVDTDGDFVVVWTSSGSSGSDTSDRSIHGQRYDASGNAIDAEFQVNTYTTLRQYVPSVSVDTDGDFVVVWTSSGSSGSDTSDRSIQGQRYDASGNAIDAEFQVNTYTTSYQWGPSVSVDADGDFVVVWSSLYGTANDGNDAYHAIQGQRYDASGNVIGSEFQVNTLDFGKQILPSVAAAADGDFVVVWESEHINDYHLLIQGQRFDASGNTVGAEFQVSNDTTTYPSYQENPKVAVDADGDFVVVWDRNGSAGSDTSGRSIQGKRYDASGNVVGAQFQVNSYTTSTQSHPSVAMSAGGDFVVSWGSNGSAGTDTDNQSIHAQRYDASGNTIGAEFQVNTYTTSGQGAPSVAVDTDGDFVVVWSSNGSSGNDDSGGSIQGQRYAVEPEALSVDLDIKPGSDPNSINPSLKGNLPVAILGSDIFDVADVDVTTLAFGPSGASFDHSHGPHFEDLNGDGFTDLLAHFRIKKTGIAFGDMEACLTGETLAGEPFEGCDAVRTVPDMDGDELLYVEEEAIGTNAFNPDTDGDGFSDGEEVLLMGTDPLDALDPTPLATEESRRGVRRRR
jgi:hypothetical protein